MVPHRRPFGRRALLPSELELCEQLGVTPDEYWQFLFDAQEYVTARSKEYERIPDVRNDPVSLLINLAIGVALSAISALLAPKPKAQDTKRREPLQIAGKQGKSRFNRSSEFDSVQQLAELGQVIPLVFAKQQEVGGNLYGGIRMESDLLFSQMVSNGNGQLLYAVMSLGMGTLGEKPDYDGLAVGDLLLRDFSAYKNRAFFSNKVDARENSRLTGDDAYSRSKLWAGDNYSLERYENKANAFSIRLATQRNDSWKQYFSGARTPGTGTQFGVYAPLPNGHRFLLPMELVLVQKGVGKETRESSKMKRRKVAMAWPRLAGITEHKKDIVTYTIFNANEDVCWFDDDVAVGSNPDWDDEFKPWGIEDIEAIQNETRIIADEQLQENQMYLIGSSLAMLTQRDKPGIWERGDATNRHYKFKIEESFPGKTAIPSGIGDKTGLDKESYLSSHNRNYGGAYPWSRATVQQAAVGSITNNRPCDITEIGIKSEVWRRMTGSINFNGMPTIDVIEEYEDDRTNISVGQVTAYMRRYSFFRLYVRKVGASVDWFNLTKAGVDAFAVLGASPVIKYNTIQIEHPEFDTYEYRFVPVPGSEFYANNRTQVLLLDARPLTDLSCADYQVTNLLGTFKIAVTGVLKGIQPDNAEWFVNDSELPPGFGKFGPILELDRYETDDPIPEVLEYGEPKTQGVDKTGADQYYVRLDGADRIENRTFVWDGKIVNLNAKPINRTTIEAYSGSELYEYSQGLIEEPGQIEKWVGANDGDPMYDLGDDPTNPGGYQECVWYDAVSGWYNYIWNGKQTVRTKQDTEIYIENSKGTVRYKRFGPVIENEWEDDPNNTGNYSRRNGQLTNGAIMQKDSEICDFYQNGNKIGSGTASKPRVYKVPNKDIRWVAKAERVAPAYLTAENGDIDAVAGVKVSAGVNIGAVDLGSKWSYYWQGEKVAESPRSKSTVVINNRTYQAVGGSRGKLVGIDKDIPCYPLVAYQHGEREINKQTKGDVPLTWQIKRQNKQEAVPQFARITRRRIRSVQVDSYTEANVPIRFLADKDNKNQSAKATVTYWPNADGGPGKASWKLTDGGNDYEATQKVFIGQGHYFDPPGTDTKISATITKLTPVDAADDNNPGYLELIEAGRNYFPLNAICDYYINDTDTSSHADSPEHSVVFVNEVIKQEGADIPEYSGLSTLGLKITNSKEWTSFSNVSAYLRQGMKIECLEKSGSGKAASNLFPNIAYALLTDPKIGAGDAVGKASVDKTAMAIAAKYCQANHFYWDGVVSEAVNLREFIFENAGFILCDFTIKGGKFALTPSLPYDSNFVIDQNAKPEIRALFTDGVVRNTEVTFLTPEERQPFQAVVLFREETPNGWPDTHSLRIRFADETDDIPVEEFDLSGFCTSRQQAQKFAKVALMLRRKVDHGIKFETTPQAAMSMEPGQYFKFASKVTHTERFASGVIDDKGNVNSSEGTTGSYKIVYWRPGTVGVNEATLRVSSDYTTTQSDLYGVVWSKVSDTENTRVYKCESLSYSDDGLVEVSGSYAPLTNNGALAILDWDDKTWFEELT